MRAQLHAAIMLLSALIADDLTAQTYSIGSCARFRVKELGGGVRMIVAEDRYGFDSSHVAVMNADANWNVTPVSARRFGTDWLWFMFDAAPSPDGMFVAGTLTDTYVPQLHFVNNDGSLAWCTGFNGMNSSQTRFAMVFSEGDDVVGYSNADNASGDATYRVETDQTGGSYVLRRITTTDNLYFRLFTGARTGVAGEHVLGGNGTTIGVGDLQAVLGHFTTNGATWLKQYEMGSDGLMEEVDAVVKNSGGGYTCAINMSGTNPQVTGGVLHVNSAGDVVWCTKLSEPDGVWLHAITELDNGNYLIAGSSVGGMGMLFTVDPTGALVGARRCASCFYSTINGFYRDAGNTLYGLGPANVYTFTSDGEACGFDPITTVTATPFTPVVTTLDPTVDMSPAITTSTINMLERTPVGSSSIACVPNAIVEAQDDEQDLVAWPVPTHGLVYLRCDGSPAPNERVLVRDLSGRVVYNGRYDAGVDLRTRAPGAYCIEWVDRGLRTTVLKE